MGKIFLCALVALAVLSSSVVFGQSGKAGTTKAGPAKSGSAKASTAAKPKVKDRLITFSEDEDATQLREWTDSTGQFSVKASLSSVEGDIVVLEKHDGGTAKLSRKKLSVADREFVTDALSISSRQAIKDAIEDLRTKDWGDTSVRINEAMRAAEEEFSQKLDGRELRLIYPVENISSLYEKDIYNISLCLPDFLGGANDYRLRFERVKLAKEDASRIDRKSVVVVTGVIRAKFPGRLNDYVFGWDKCTPFQVGYGVGHTASIALDRQKIRLIFNPKKSDAEITFE